MYAHVSNTKPSPLTAPSQVLQSASRSCATPGAKASSAESISLGALVVAQQSLGNDFRSQLGTIMTTTGNQGALVDCWRRLSSLAQETPGATAKPFGAPKRQKQSSSPGLFRFLFRYRLRKSTYAGWNNIASRR